MSTTFMRRSAAAVALAAAATLAVAGCSSSSSTPAGSSSAASDTSMPANMPGMDMSSSAATTTEDTPVSPTALSTPLTDQNGNSFTLGSLKGKTIVLTDILTTCQEVCPMTTVNIHDVAAAVHAAGLDSSVAVLEGTVDPERDVPSRLLAYQKLYGPQPAWSLFTAGTGATEAFWESFGVKFDRVKEDDPAPTDWLTGKPLTYDIDHDDAILVIDPTGHIRWSSHGMANTTGHQPPKEIYDFLSDEGHDNLNHPPAGSWTVADVTSALTTVTGHKV